MGIDIPAHVAARAATKFVVVGDCHVSTYSVASHGYAQIGWHSRGDKLRGTTAHRATWTHFNGQIPEGMTIDHLCKNRPCVRLEHLRMLSNFENARRTFGRDWPEGQCRHGHDNSELRWNGSKWYCGICRKRWMQNYEARKKQAA
jgi:HNH endonuclease